MQSEPSQKSDSTETRRGPKKRLLVGLLALSYVLGLPTVALVELVALWLGSDTLALYGGPLVYGFSWVLLGVVLVLGGPEISDQLRELVQRYRKRYLTR